MLLAMSLHKAAHARRISRSRGPDHDRPVPLTPIMAASNPCASFDRGQQVRSQHQAAHAERSSVRVGLTTTKDRKLDRG